MKKIFKSKKGFTLAELLVVVAIIAELVAIAIPTFTAVTDKAEEAVEVANARATYGEAMAALIGGGALGDLSTNGRTYDGKTYTASGTAENLSIAVTNTSGSSATIYNSPYTKELFETVEIDGSATSTPASA